MTHNKHTNTSTDESIFYKVPKFWLFPLKIRMMHMKYNYVRILCRPFHANVSKLCLWIWLYSERVAVDIHWCEVNNG